MIKVTKKDENTFTVKVNDMLTETSHIVHVSDEDYQQLTEGKITKEELVKKSFLFLLEQESKKSILKEFTIMVIADYFPDYVEIIKSSLKYTKSP